MKPLLLIAIAILAVGCGGKDEVTDETKPKLKSVNYGELEFREGVFYLKGVDTRYTGNAIALYENGQKQAEDNFKDGKRDGLQLFWHQNGQKRGEINWKNGKQNGLYVGWYENGKKAMEEKYKDGKPYGLYMAWHENGQKRSEGNYKNGIWKSLKVRLSFEKFNK